MSKGRVPAIELLGAMKNPATDERTSNEVRMFFRGELSQLYFGCIAWLQAPCYLFTDR